MWKSTIGQAPNTMERYERPLALFVIGPTCCGKTETGSYFASVGFNWLEPSDYVKGHIPLNIPLLDRLKAVDSFFGRVGKDYVGKLLLSHALQPETRTPLVITGCRQPVEVELIQQYFRTVVLALQVDDTIRFSRCVKRARADSPPSFDAFLRATAWEYSLGLAQLVLKADYLVSNNGAISDLHRGLQDALAEMRYF